MQRNGWAAAVVALAVVLGAGACGGDEALPVSAGDASTTTAADSMDATDPPGTAPPRNGQGGNRPNPANTSTSTTLRDRVTTTAAAGPEDLSEEGYVDAFLEADRLEDAPLDQRRCIAEGLVQAIGVDELRAAGVTPSSIEDGSKGLRALTIDRPLAEELVDVYPECGYDLARQMVVGFAGVAHGDPEVRACLETEVSDEVARELAVLMFQGDSPETEEALDDLYAAELDFCFRPR
jgi:hypothetical protein